MKLKISSILLILAVISLSAFKNSSKPEAYTVDITKSNITWFGKKITGSHNGTIAIQSGKLNIDGKNITGGTFTIDMNSLKDVDGSAKLENHLKSDDFFGVAKFPTSTFVITKVEGSGANVIINGNLTIKGITNPLRFPASISVNSDGTFSALAGKIIVDRSKYDVRYGSKSFFDTLGDKAIDDNFELTVKLLTKK